jgi:hypothetical protein
MGWKKTNNSDEHFTFSSDARAYVPGTYYFASTVKMTGNTLDSGTTMPNDDDDPSRWTMITIITSNEFKMEGGRFVLGIGTSKNSYPSLVANGNILFESGGRIALLGTVWGRSELQLKSGSWNSSDPEFHGPIRTLGNITVENGGKLEVKFNDPIMDGGSTVTFAKPVQPRLAYPTPY